MVNVFGDSVGSGSVDLQLVKKVVTTVGTFGDYIDEIRQSYELGFPPYRFHTNGYGTFVTPIRVYNGKVYVLDDETGKRGVVGSECPPGKFGKIGPPGPVGGKGSVGERGEKGYKGDVGSGGPPGPAGSKGNVGARGEKGEKGNVGGL